MASGKEHDRSTKLWSIPFGIGLAILMDVRAGLIGGLGFFIGGLWLSPDLDTKSRSLKRWGILQKIWLPYRKLLPHRSFFSHAPFIGTALRLSYLIAWLLIIINIMKFLGLIPPIAIFEIVQKQIQTYFQEALALFIGIEASAMLHLIKDGDPISK